MIGDVTRAELVIHLGLCWSAIMTISAFAFRVAVTRSGRSLGVGLIFWTISTFLFRLYGGIKHFFVVAYPEDEMVEMWFPDYQFMSSAWLLSSIFLLMACVRVFRSPRPNKPVNDIGASAEYWR
jgi:uncharacterized membrane protein YwaF